MGMSARAYFFYGYAWKDENQVESDKYHELDWKLQKELVVQLQDYGHCDYRIPFIYVKGTKITADWEAVPVKVDLPAGSHLWDVQLQDFAASFDLDLTEADGPGWFMAPFYG